jgi:hypothetical protein
MVLVQRKKLQKSDTAANKKVAPAKAKAKNTAPPPTPNMPTTPSIAPKSKADHDNSTDPVAIQLAKANLHLLQLHEEATNAVAKARAEVLELTKASKDDAVARMAESKKEALELKNETIRAVSESADMITSLLKDKTAAEKEREIRASDAQSKADKRKFYLDMASIITKAGDLSAEKNEFMKQFMCDD